jgi:hydroxymethylpyrimidine/phosphomethylpyrimidine kinase
MSYTGMLASAETIEIVADTFRRYNVATTVVDPVCCPSLYISVEH